MGVAADAFGPSVGPLRVRVGIAEWDPVRARRQGRSSNGAIVCLSAGVLGPGEEHEWKDASSCFEGIGFWDELDVVAILQATLRLAWSTAAVCECRCSRKPPAAGCLVCSACMDAFMDHAFVCPCGGDRTLRHNALHDVFFSHFCVGGVKGGKGEGGSLARPDDEGPRTESLRDGRRPADAWVAGWDWPIAAAIDFAVTSGLRPDRLAESARDPGDV